MITWKAEQEPIMSVPLGKGAGKRKNISICWLLFTNFSKLLQEIYELRQELTILLVEVELNKNTFKFRATQGWKN